MEGREEVAQGMKKKQKQPQKKQPQQKADSTASSAAPRRPLRVLCFHGFGQSSDILRNKTLKNFRQRCVNRLDVEFVYPPSMHKLEEASKEEGVDVFHWWITVPQEAYLTGGTETVGIKETLQSLAQWIVEDEAKNGPFDGVLGYSQGGVLASLLCAVTSASSVPEPFHEFANQLRFGFKFGIFFCAFPARADPYKRVYEGLSESSVIPTLHVWGQADDIVPPEYSKELAALFPGAATFEHPTGHVIPTNSPAKQAYLRFLQAFASTKS